jgi:hypothetical protein
LQQFTQFYRHFSAVRQFDSHRVFSRDRRENINSFGTRGSSEVTLKAYNLIHTHAFSRIDFVTSDGWALGDVARRHGNPELSQGFN